MRHLVQFVTLTAAATGEFRDTRSAGAIRDVKGEFLRWLNKLVGWSEAAA